MSIINRKRKGVARTIIFKSGKKYKAVCLDFDIIEEAYTRDEVEKQIKEAIVGYIENICKNKLSDKLLNRYAEKKYWGMYHRLLKQIEGQEMLRAASNDISMFTLPINLKTSCLV